MSTKYSSHMSAKSQTGSQDTTERDNKNSTYAYIDFLPNHHKDEKILNGETLLLNANPSRSDEVSTFKMLIRSFCGCLLKLHHRCDSNKKEKEVAIDRRLSLAKSR